MSEPPKLADPDRRYFAWRQAHPTLVEDPRAVWAEAWRQAYWAGLRETSQLGLQLLEVITRVEALEQRLRDLQHGEEIERELEQSSEYWKSHTHA